MQPPSVDAAAQQLTQVLGQLAGADQVHSSIGASDQEHSIVAVDLTEIGGLPDVGVVAELVGLPPVSTRASASAGCSESGPLYAGAST